MSDRLKKVASVKAVVVLLAMIYCMYKSKQKMCASKVLLAILIWSHIDTLHVECYILEYYVTTGNYMLKNYLKILSTLE